MVHRFFFPSHENNYRAGALQHTSILFYILAFLLFHLVGAYVRFSNPYILGYATDISIEKVLVLVNEERAKEHLPPLALSSSLSIAATQKGTDMFAKNYWAHVSPTGVTPWDFIRNAGYEYIYAGENLAKNFNTSQDLVAAWMNSPTHRDNILKPEYKEIGLAVINGVLQGEQTTLVVQEFGSPLDELADQTISPIPLPSPIGVRQIENSEIEQYVQGIPASSPHASIIALTSRKGISMLVVEFLLVVLLFDGIAIWRQRTVRVAGKNIAHIIFFAAILGAMGATGIGVIL